MQTKRKNRVVNFTTYTLPSILDKRKGNVPSLTPAYCINHTHRKQAKEVHKYILETESKEKRSKEILWKQKFVVFFILYHL
jgi:hypothetical protein